MSYIESLKKELAHAMAMGQLSRANSAWLGLSLESRERLLLAILPANPERKTTAWALAPRLFHALPDYVRTAIHQYIIPKAKQPA